MYATNHVRDQPWTRPTMNACYDRGAPLFFLRLLALGAQDMSCFNPKTDLEKNKTALIPDEKCHGLGTQPKPCKKYGPLFFFFSDDSISRLRSPVIRKKFISNENCYLCRSTRPFCPFEANHYTILPISTHAITYLTCLRLGGAPPR